MKQFHVNIGHLFAKPFESWYAIVRRCLVANPGMPYSAVMLAFRMSAPSGESTANQLILRQLLPRTRIPHPHAHVSKSYQRQCPLCAYTLYHSDVFFFPWLTHCPIHHCALTEFCPTCERPWPDIKKLHLRDCPHCGQIPIEQLQNTIPADDYRIIEDIHKFLTTDERDHFLVGRCGGGPNDVIHPWLREISIHSPLYATCQAHRRFAFTSSQLDSLHIQRPPLWRRTTQLRATDYADMPPIWSDWTGRCVHLAPTPRRPLDLHYDTMCHIVAWIFNKTSGHSLRIANYRGLLIQDFWKEHPPCPYCLALSLWFFHTASARYGYYFEKHIDNYPFLMGDSGLFTICEPYVRTKRDGILTPDDDFSNWFYKRGMEHLFLSILRSIFDWRERLEQSLHTNYGFLYKSELEIPCTFYGTSLSDHNLTFYYEREHPLDTYSPPTIESLNMQCIRYHDHHSQKFDFVYPFNYEIPRVPFLYNSFLKLHNEFRYFLAKSTN